VAIDEAHRVEQGFSEHGYVDFRAAGTLAAGEFRCADCGYGAIVHRELPPCPMCGGSVWERSDWGLRNAARLQ
jgi:rubrerythrin